MQYNDNSETENKVLIRTLDFFGRKLMHFFSIMILTYGTGLVLDGEILPSLSGIVFVSILELLLSFATYISASAPKKYRKYYAPFLYGGHNRIQDGHAALLNVTTSLFVSCFRTLLTGLFLIFVLKDQAYSFSKAHYPDTHSARKLLLLSWIITNNGVAFGDTAGEGVGAFLGKHRFKVKGFDGQENERSVEGCAAVFFFTALSNILAVYFCSDLLQLYPFWTFMLLLFLPITTTLVEAYSFKGTDNMLISFSNQVIVFLWFKAML